MTEIEQYRALVVDDETQMLSIVSFALQTQGFTCAKAKSAEEAWRLLTTRTFDLVVLDVMLPGSSGMELCSRIRSSYNTPVILLTSLAEEDDRVEGLEAGADDYVTKPFSPRELALRAQAIARRSGRAPRAEVLQNGDLQIDPVRRSAVIGTERISLSEIDTKLLLALASRPGQILSWRQLLNEVWEVNDQAGGKEMVKTAIYRLRVHLGTAGEDYVVTVRGRGYSMPVQKVTGA